MTNKGPIIDFHNPHEQPFYFCEEPIISYDVESTGPNPTSDAIIQIGVVAVCNAGKSLHKKSWLVKPWKPIPKEATDVHGITNEMVENAPSFEQVWNEVREFIGDTRIFLGYEIFRFDIPITQEELSRIGYQSIWPDPEALVIDAANIYRKKDPRTLTAAVRKFCDREPTGAHDACNDALDTFDVLRGQVAQYGDLHASHLVKNIADFSKPDGMVDYAGKLTIRPSDGKISYNFGQKKGFSVEEDPGYAEWMLGRDFPVDTKRHLRAELDRLFPQHQADLDCHEGD